MRATLAHILFNYTMMIILMWSTWGARTRKTGLTACARPARGLFRGAQTSAPAAFAGYEVRVYNRVYTGCSSN